MRIYVAIKLLALVTWVLPRQHPAILLIYGVAAEIDEAAQGITGDNK